MHGTKEIIEEVSSLPVDDRVSIVDALLRTLNAPDQEMDSLWSDTAERRLLEVRSGRVEVIPAEIMLGKIQERLKK